jgi:hypothetical protein
MKNNINKGFKFTLGKTIFIVTKVNENKVYFTDLKHVTIVVTIMSLKTLRKVRKYYTHKVILTSLY